MGDKTRAKSKEKDQGREITRDKDSTYLVLKGHPVSRNALFHRFQKYISIFTSHYTPKKLISSLVTGCFVTRIPNHSHGGLTRFDFPHGSEIDSLILSKPPSLARFKNLLFQDR